ncbi:MAG: heme-binding protein [Blastochloris sp.]|nr:heme-binding protein [Blastochloris sp.]
MIHTRIPSTHRLLAIATPLLALLLLALPAQAQLLTAADVQLIVNQASSRAAQISPNSVVSVVDREGNVLVVWACGAAPNAAQIGETISRAGTASFLNSNQNAFTTRTAAYVVQDNFPPGIINRNNGPLTGVNFSHLPYSDVNRFRAPPFPDYTLLAAFPDITTNILGNPILNTSLSGFIGGVPLYKQGVLVGGVGVTGDGNDTINPISVNAADVDEDVALAGQIGFEPAPSIRANRVFLEGISVPYVRSTTSLPNPLAPVGAAVAAFPINASPLPASYPLIPNAYPPATFAGVNGELRAPIISDPNVTASSLTAADVNNIIEAAVERALITRSNVRNPIGGPTSMWIAVVGNANNNAVAPPILGIFKMPDAVTRSWDFAVAKARTCVGFSSTNFAFSSRTVGFMSQNFYPPGINGTAPGPFRGLQATYSNSAVLVAPNSFFRNGITIFPGGQPLYRDGVLVGGIGVSGDAIDQDDLVAAAGTAAPQADGSGNFVAPANAKADRYAFRGVRLPLAKFPRQPVR